MKKINSKILYSALSLSLFLFSCGTSTEYVQDQNTVVNIPDPSSQVKAPNTKININANKPVNPVYTESSITTAKTSTETLSASSEQSAKKLLEADDLLNDDQDKINQNVSLLGTTESYTGSANPDTDFKKFQLELKSHSFIDKRFIEPSSLCFDENGALYTVTDKLHYTIYKLDKSGLDYEVSDAVNMNFSQILKMRLKKKNKFDFEGIDYYNGAFYVADERDRKIEKIDRSGNIVDLNIDLNGYMKEHGIRNDVTNSGLEGLAIDPVNKLLYVIKERQESAILVVDMTTNKVIRHFKANLPGNVEPALTDAKVFDGFLYVLVRSHRLILKMDPVTGKILSTYDYRKYEEDPNYVYVKIPTIGSGNDPDGYGVMEGLAVTKDSFYVATDNNMLPLKKSLLNNKPQLFIFSRPE